MTGSRFTAAGWLRRIILCAVSYVVLYFVAGMLIIPYVSAFYDTQDIPVGAWILPLQLLRGGLYVAFALPLLRSLSGGRWRVAFATACLFPVLAGAFGLLIPNPYLPDWVRPFHILEIAGSNFLFGLLVGYQFWNPCAGQRASREVPPRQVPAARAA